MFNWLILKRFLDVESKAISGLDAGEIPENSY